MEGRGLYAEIAFSQFLSNAISIVFVYSISEFESEILSLSQVLMIFGV